MPFGEILMSENVDFTTKSRENVISRDFMNGDVLVKCIYICIIMYNLLWCSVEVTFMSTNNVNV